MWFVLIIIKKIYLIRKYMAPESLKENMYEKELV
jgi:hypothetical protein